ncbi:MAG TPA: TonB family protein [Caulobacteraceae bacterium]
MILAALAALVLASAAEPAAPPSAGAPPTPKGATAKPVAASPVVTPHWVAQPSAEQFAQAYPVSASLNGISGSAVIRCSLGAQGVLKDCRVVSESPSGQGFAAAALKLAPLFRVGFDPGLSMPTGGLIAIPIRFAAPTALGSHPSAEAQAFVVTAPDWIRRPSAQDLMDVWPAQATKKGVGGHAVLSCLVNVHGLLEQCQAVSEDPPGLGFGAAALLLAPRFQMRPMSLNGVPRPGGTVQIPIRFQASAGRGGETVLLIPAPPWIAAPSFADVAKAYPGAGHGPVGRVVFRCRARRDGRVDDCLNTIADQTPSRFESAARSLVGKFRAQIDPAVFSSYKEVDVQLAIRLPPPDDPDFEARRIGRPLWTALPTPEQMAEFYPAQALARGVKSGQGKVECTVAADGVLSGCAAKAADPPDLGFSEAAVKVAGALKMSLWTQEGGPVVGADITIPVRFDAPTERPRSSAP